MLSKVIETVFADRVPSESTGSSRRVRAVGRLLAMLGVVLFLGLAVEGVTIVFIGQTIAIHVVLGMILLPIILYKILIATYRFSMYYLGARDFKRAGPPELLLRIVAPLLVVTTLLVIATGIILVYTRPGTSSASYWLVIHRDTFIAWFVFCALHVLAYVRRAMGTGSEDLRHSRYHWLLGRSGRLVSIAIALGMGVVLAVAVLPAASTWAHYFSSIHSR